MDCHGATGVERRWVGPPDVSRGHRCCRYADEAKVYVKSRRADERVMESLSEYLESSLRLTVNRIKIAVGRPWKRGYLGYRLIRHKRLRQTLVKANLSPLY